MGRVHDTDIGGGRGSSKYIQHQPSDGTRSRGRHARWNGTPDLISQRGWWVVRGVVSIAAPSGREATCAPAGRSLRRRRALAKAQLSGSTCRSHRRSHWGQTVIRSIYLQLVPRARAPGCAPNTSSTWMKTSRNFRSSAPQSLFPTQRLLSKLSS
jgi:hypothetical protein